MTTGGNNERTGYVKLKPCPFCGGKAESYRASERRLYADGSIDVDWVVDCSKCNANIELHPNQVEAEEAWNSRTAQCQAWQPIDTAPAGLRVWVHRSDIGLTDLAYNDDGVWRYVDDKRQLLSQPDLWQPFVYPAAPAKQPKESFDA